MSPQSHKGKKPVIGRGPIPIPTPGSIYGPQTTITCSGGVSIPGGSTTASRQALINANPGATFCISNSAPHTANGSNFPTSGQTFIAQYGAVIDGTGWASSDLDDAFFRSVDTGVTGVTIRNLELKNGPCYGINTYKSSSGWITEYCYIHHNRNGIGISRNSQVNHNSIKFNKGVLADPNPALRGGGYGGDGAENTIFTFNEVAFNGEEQKFLSGGPNTAGLGYFNRNLRVNNNWFHENVANGFWIDGDGEGSIIENNLCEDNGTGYAAAGMVLEKAYRVILRTNNVNRNSSGIYISENRESQILDNILNTNNVALDVFVDCSDVGTSLTAMTWTIDLINNVWLRNICTIPTGASIFGVALSVGGACGADYFSNLKNNNFNFNSYDVPNPAGNYWLWNGSKTFAQWQAIPQDLNGSVS